MDVNLKCFATLANMESCRHDHASTVSLDKNATVRDLAQHANINEQDINTVFVNSKQSRLDENLSDGDNVAFVPAVGGM